MLGWVTDAQTTVNKDLEVVGEGIYDDNLKIPTYMYVTVGIRGKEIRLGFDTGSVRTLIAEQVFNEKNTDYMFQLLPHESRFEAVNGSKIDCLG